MPIYKIQIKENGCIFGVQRIEADDDAFWVDGIVIDEAFYQEVVADLLLAVNAWYFDFQTETFVSRPVITATPIQTPEQFLLTGLPIPCTVTVEDAGTYEVDDGEFGFPLTLSGNYKVKVEAFPYITKEWEVIVP